MLKSIMHIGLTVSSLEKSIKFYEEVLGLTYIGRLTMEGKETEELFNRKNCKCVVGYLVPKGDIDGPTIELIEFKDEESKKYQADLFKTSISEICFETDDIDKEYERLKAHGVEFISEPKDFDFESDGFSRSKALYFKDIDGIILELMETK